MRTFLCFIILIALSACSSSEPAIVKKDSPPEDPNKEPEVIEQQEDDEDEPQKFLDFAMHDEEIMVNLNKVPILDAYLKTATDQRQALEKMRMSRINTSDKSLYLLEFSCEDNLCSYLLLDQTDTNQTYLLADLAQSIQTKVSPDESHILFQFNRESTFPLPTSDIVVIDLEAWQTVPLENRTRETDMLAYTWPIITAEWADESSITATVPDITEPTKDTLQQWQTSDQRTVTVDFSLTREKE